MTLKSKLGVTHFTNLYTISTSLEFKSKTEDGRHIEFRTMSISSGQTTSNKCKIAFSLHVVDSVSDDYNSSYICCNGKGAQFCKHSIITWFRLATGRAVVSTRIHIKINVFSQSKSRLNLTRFNNLSGWHCRCRLPLPVLTNARRQSCRYGNQNDSGPRAQSVIKLQSPHAAIQGVTFGRLAVSDFELGMNVIVYLFTVLYCI